MQGQAMQPIAARLGVDHQQLQQFVTSSTWDHVEVRKRVARWADDFLDPDAYVIGFPKDGSDSTGVARMYSGTLEKVGNWADPRVGQGREERRPHSCATSSARSRRTEVRDGHPDHHG